MTDSHLSEAVKRATQNAVAELGQILTNKLMRGNMMQQYREVERAPKSGDKIKIVKTGCHGPALVMGDVHTITSIHNPGGKYEWVETDKGNGFYEIEYGEFVVLEPINEPLVATTITNSPIVSDGTLTIGSKSVKLTDEQMSALGLVSNAAQKRHDAMVELNERLWRFAMENGGEIDHHYYVAWRIENASGSTWDVNDWNKVMFPGLVCFARREACQRAIDEIIIPYCKEHPELGL